MPGDVAHAYCTILMYIKYTKIYQDIPRYTNDILRYTEVMCGEVYILSVPE